jgi:hypothetical protein
MDQTSFNKFKDMTPESIMKVEEVCLVEPVSSKRKNEQEFEFTFSTNTFTDPEWRDIFKKHYGSEKARFHGSEFTLTCKPTDLESEVSKVKLLILSTNQDYQKQREALLSEIAAHKEEARISAINKNAEEDDVNEMFKNFKV